MHRGILNNTNRSHELVDLIAKVSADKNLDFDFADNKKLKESGFALEGVYVNGFVGNNGITINVNSKKALNSVVGHEISHVLEGTELYTSLQSELKNYLGDAEYSKRLNSIKETYKNVYKGEDAETKFEQELTADLVGDLLFTDSDFVYRLSTENRNVFEKIFDEIKYLCRIATAGSKEARQLEKIKKTFEDAYRESGQTQKNTATEDGVRYALAKDINGNVFVDVTEDIFDSTNGETVARTIQRVISERFNNLIDVHGQKIQINKTTNDEFRRSESVNHLLKSSSHTYNDKLKTIANADEILSAAKNWIGEEIKHTRKDDIVEFARGNVMYRVGDNGYVADVIVGIRKNSAAVLYDLINIYDKKITEAPVTMVSNDNSQRRQDASAKLIISQNSRKSRGNAKFSLYSEIEDVAPIRNGIYGKDVVLQSEELAPVKETVSKKEKVNQDLAPVRNDLKPKTAPSDDLAPVREDINNGFSIKQQLKNSQEKLNNMDVVASYNDSKIFESNQEAVEWTVKQFESIDYKVNREGFGEIVLDKKRVKTGMSYLKTTEEKLAFAMVPDVLQKGIEIANHENHKSRKYSTVTFAAPVELNGARGNMAVVVRRQDKNYYKVHRLIMPDGSQFVLDEKRDNAETAGGVENNSGLSPTDNVSNNIISKTEPIVNNNDDLAPVRKDLKPKSKQADKKAARIEEGQADVPQENVDSYVSTKDRFERKVQSYQTNINANIENKKNSLDSFNKQIADKQI